MEEEDKTANSNLADASEKDETPKQHNRKQQRDKEPQEPQREDDDDPQTDEDSSIPPPEEHGSPDDARYLTTVMEDEEADDVAEASSAALPVFQYNRIFGSLPRADRAAAPLSIKCTCAAMGKVILSPDVLAETTAAPPNPNHNNIHPNHNHHNNVHHHHHPMNNHNNIHHNNLESSRHGVVTPEIWQHQPVHVAAFGFENGSLYVVEALSGAAVAQPDKWTVREGRASHPIVSLSWDSTGTFLGAADAGGMCTVFELRYAVQMRSSSQTTESTVPTLTNPVAALAESSASVLTSWMSALTGGGALPRADGAANPNNATSNNNQASEPAEEDESEEHWIPTLTVASMQVQRTSYSSTFGKPTCLAIDPAYKRKRNIVMGFGDGRVIMIRPAMFGRQEHVIYHAVKEDDSVGIETIAWRGSLVAWADASGVRLFDVEISQRIAHIRRPPGARSSLHPSVTRVHPSLCFETENHLLMGWGDSLMTWHIRPPVIVPRIDAMVPQRRQVECAMAWELDCLACGVVPLDANHVAVLGLVPPVIDDDHEENDEEDITEVANNQNNEVELQIISRASGAVVYADMLPLVNSENTKRVESTKDYAFLSSFAIPRMGGNSEMSETGLEPLIIQNAMFGLTGSTTRQLRDSHLMWSLDKVVVEDENFLGSNTLLQLDDDEEPVDGEEADSPEHDTVSVDSDDYELPLRPIPEPIAVEDMEDSSKAIPPVMLLASVHDIVLCRTRDVDDAVSYALEQEKYALALHRALQHAPRLRRYQIQDLVNQYLAALLRTHDDSPLSIRRFRIAAQAMPVLLGGKADHWEHWIEELERLPGGLFAVRDAIPVRDPRLSNDVYSRMILKMVGQIGDLKDANETKDGGQSLTLGAENHLLGTLVFWGTTHTLNEFSHIYEFQAARDPKFEGKLEEVRGFAKWRKEQTAACYLNFGKDSRRAIPPSESVVTHDTQDALFEIETIMKAFRSLIQLDQWSSETESYFAYASTPSVNSRFVLEALATLSMMKGDFEGMLYWYCLVGAFHSASAIEDVGEEAVKRTAALEPPVDDGRHSAYGFLILLIEKHHLHRWVLDANFLPENLGILPIEALAMLVGLQPLGELLIKYCVAPQKAGKNAGQAANNETGETPETNLQLGTFPIDLVAEQLDGKPKLLHWYLQMVFEQKPEFYVKFPSTAVPPSVITDLHRKNLELHIQYAGVNRDSSKVFEGVETYKCAELSTPFLSFLKAVIPLGGISLIEVRKMIDEERKSWFSVFALELAYIRENFGNNETAADVAMVLDLYLKGAKSLVLAVSYAQRTPTHSSDLWETLIKYCLVSTTDSWSQPHQSGMLFGSLLEAAALTGADLAHLVRKIPHGMVVEGLRPRLVAAVADYRLKLGMHESAAKIATSERVDLLSECSHRARRGCWCAATARPVVKVEEEEKSDSQITDGFIQRRLPASLRPRTRPDHHQISFSLAIR